MCELCPNFPIKETLEKVGKGSLSSYNIASPAWLEAFNKAWTNKNLDSLKKIAKYKVLQETRPYRDPSKSNEILAGIGADPQDEASFPVLLADTHPLDNLRMNVCSQMFDPMYDKLGVAEGDDMYLAPEKRIAIWGENS